MAPNRCVCTYGFTGAQCERGNERRPAVLCISLIHFTSNCFCALHSLLPAAEVGGFFLVFFFEEHVLLLLKRDLMLNGGCVCMLFFVFLIEDNSCLVMPPAPGIRFVVEHLHFKLELRNDHYFPHLL